MEKQGRFSRYLLTGILLIGIVILAFWLRVQGVAQLPPRQFTEHDAYLYYYQAETIAERGSLPARDMHRWLPFGRDNTQLLSLYAYAIAYLHKVFRWLSLYHIQLYLPVVSFVVGLGVLFLFLTCTYGIRFASIVGVLLATLPGSIERSAAGFGDRDAWCWMVGILSVTSYLWKEQIPYNPPEKGGENWRRYLATALSGFTAFLGGLSWEAFGSFLLIIHAAELWKFCTTKAESPLREYILWMLMFVPWLFLISPVYRSGYGFSTHAAALMLAPPLAIFTLHGVRYLLLNLYESLHLRAQKLSWFLVLLAITAGLVFFFLQSHTFEATAFAFSENRLMKSVGELKDPNFKYWIERYGTIFISGSFGVIAASFQLWKWKGLPLIGSLSLFIGTTFFRDVVSGWTSTSMCDTLFFISLGLVLLSLGSLAYLRREMVTNEIVTFAMLMWFLLWVGLSRGGKRYDFFIGVSVAFFAATFIQFLANAFCGNYKQNAQSNLLKTGIACVMLAAFMFFPPFGAHARRSVFAATQMRNATPENRYMIAAFHWIKTELPRTAVVAAGWSYGTQLNVFSGVKTITDPDHYIPYWIDLYERHVYRATSERETLEFLKTHGATHLMLTRTEFATNPLLNQQYNDAFVPIYPIENFFKARVKIWEICYPPDIKTNPKYLETGFPEIDTHLQLQ